MPPCEDERGECVAFARRAQSYVPLYLERSRGEPRAADHPSVGAGALAPPLELARAGVAPTYWLEQRRPALLAALAPEGGKEEKGEKRDHRGPRARQRGS